MKNLTMKVCLELANFFLNNRLIFSFFGRLRLFDAVFVVYPANQEFADYFCFRFRQRRIKTNPFIIGWATHPSGKRSLNFAISLTEAEMHGRDEGMVLRDLHEITSRIQVSLGAQSVHYAGVLPSIMRKRGIERQDFERDATVTCVSSAVKKLFENHVLDKDFTPIVLLGCLGFIGSSVFERLREEGFQVIGIDKGDQFPVSVLESAHLVINIATPGALLSCLKYFNKHTIFLNEVYPAPSVRNIVTLKNKRVAAYHLRGVFTKSFPGFPFEYGGALPCCGALRQENYNVLLHQMYKG